MVASVMAGRQYSPALLMASASAALARFGHHGLLDQHVPAARGGGDPVLGMKRRGCGNHHAVGGGIDIVHAREIANCLIRMKVGIRLDHPDELAFGLACMAAMWRRPIRPRP